MTGEIAFFLIVYSWPTRIAFGLGVLVFAALAFRWKEKHMHPQYDDHLSFEKMDEAREWIVSRGVKRRRHVED